MAVAFFKYIPSLEALAANKLAQEDRTDASIIEELDRLEIPGLEKMVISLVRWTQLMRTQRLDFKKLQTLMSVEVYQEYMNCFQAVLGEKTVQQLHLKPCLPNLYTLASRVRWVFDHYSQLYQGDLSGGTFAKMRPIFRSLSLLNFQAIAKQQPSFQKADLHDFLLDYIPREEIEDLEHPKDFYRILETYLHDGKVQNPTEMLVRAAQRGDLEISNLLLHYGANVQGLNIATPLHAAATYGHFEAVKFFLDQGANVNQTINVDGVTVLTNHPLLSNYVIHNGFPTGIPLHAAADNGHAGIVQLLLEKGANVNRKNREDYTPLHLSVLFGRLEATQLLLEKEADVNAQNKWGNTPLHLVEDVEIAELLLDKGADVDIYNKNFWFNFLKGHTPLQKAIKEEKSQELIALLDQASKNKKRSLVQKLWLLGKKFWKSYCNVCLWINLCLYKLCKWTFLGLKNCFVKVRKKKLVLTFHSPFPLTFKPEASISSSVIYLIIWGVLNELIKMADKVGTNSYHFVYPRTDQDYL